MPQYKSLIAKLRRAHHMSASAPDRITLYGNALAAVEALVAENERLRANWARGADEKGYCPPYTVHISVLEALAGERDAARSKLKEVRKYADDRAWYAAQNRTVSSVRIASDLFHILGLGPDGKGPASDGQPQSKG